MPKIRMLKRKASTPRQQRALALISNGEQPTTAMIKAGFSKFTARNPKKNLFMASNLVSMVEKLQISLQDEGLTAQYIAKKMKQLLEAQKTDKADYSIQIQGLKMVNDIYNIKKEENHGVKRRMTFEEFVNEEDKNNATNQKQI